MDLPEKNHSVEELSSGSLMQNERMRILVICNKSYIDGSMSMMGGILRENSLLKMLEEYYDIKIFCPQTRKIKLNRLSRVVSMFTTPPWASQADEEQRRANDIRLDSELEAFVPHLILVLHPTMLAWISLKCEIPIILDSYDIMWVVEKRLQEQQGRIQGWRGRLRIDVTRRYEQQKYGLVDEVWVCSDKDLDTINSMNYKGSIRVVPNFHIHSSLPNPDYNNTNSTILFVGYMPYVPNKSGMSWFLRNCWQSVRDHVPNARCVIVGKWGKQPPDDEFHQPGVELLGYVDDLDEVYSQATVFICPLFSGSGTRLKILEAWHYGLPIISTSIGIEGISAIPGIHAVITDEPVQFTNAVINLLQNQSYREVIGMAGQAMANSNYSAQRIGSLAAYYCWDIIHSSKRKKGA